MRVRTGRFEKLRLSESWKAKSVEVFDREYIVQASFAVSPPGEQFSLEWGQVDLKRKIIRLTQTKNGSARNVPLNAVALAELQQQRKAVSHEAGEPVFPRPGPQSDCRWWFGAALREAKITDYTWHNNRHTFCSWLAIAGVSTKEIQVLAGHKTITMAARYAHLSPEATASASERLVIL